MNKGFFGLPEEKQNKILNAGYKIFAQSDYKKAPVSEIAAEAGISKALLFYHFKNKKELYLFLWDKAVNLPKELGTYNNIFTTNDFFEVMRRTLMAKCDMMIKYPYISAFLLRAYNETNSEVHDEIQNSYNAISGKSKEKILDLIDTSKLRDDLDILDIYQEMTYASYGYMYTVILDNSKELDAVKIKADFEKLISLWEKVYRKQQ